MMNRKARRAAGQTGKAAPPAVEALLRRAREAYRQGRAEQAIAPLREALAAAPHSAALHAGLAECHRALDRPVEAEKHYRRAAALQPDAVALLNLGNALMDLHRPADAAASYRAALRFDPRLPQAHYGLGTALAANGSAEQAARAFAAAIAQHPDFALAHEALVETCLASDDWDAALRAACLALLHLDTTRLRVQFVDAVTRASLSTDLPGLREAMARALREGWTRPQDLTRAACEIVSRDAPVGATDALLRCVLALAPICHRAIEQALTAERRRLLQLVVYGAEATPEDLAAAAALARQGFINEYVWPCMPEDHGMLDEVCKRAEADLAGGGTPPDLTLAAIAMHRPLSSLAGAECLLSHPVSPLIADLFAQQIAEPADEQRRHGTIRRATAIDDLVSQKVRDQYEQNPYPRWVAVAGAMPRVRLGDWLQGRFPAAPLAPLPNRTLDALVAGCGTGQQAVETIRALDGIRVLGIDLSLTSLAYAARMTAALAVPDIDYAQADLLRAAELGRSFDFIAVGGVLHHLADPWAGWRALLACLRPGGVMNVLLYTRRGRGDVDLARQWIAARGYRPTPDDIRRCRQDLAALPDEWARRLSASADFCSTSGCRDLLFHVQERPVCLPEVAAFLARENLTLLGVELPAHVERAFEASHGADACRDLASWDRFEAEHPRCFAAMLNLWVRRQA